LFYSYINITKAGSDKQGGCWKKGVDALGDRFQRKAKWEKYEYFK
jgi:hypothetical protein